MVSLAFSDFLFSSIPLPLTASRYIDAYKYDDWEFARKDIKVCRLFTFFLYGNMATSLTNLVAVTINRYILICHYR